VGFLPLIYAVASVFIGFCGYVCISIVGGLDSLGKRVFVATVAFGASSYVGFILILLVGYMFHVSSAMQGPFQKVVLGLAYVVPGLAGAWLSLKGLNLLKRPEKKPN
jgi:hypothetical protein